MPGWLARRSGLRWKATERAIRSPGCLTISTLSINVIKFDSLASTNTETTRQALLGAPEGTCIVAREQTSGRGRRERVWVSPADAGLYFSILLRPRIEIAEWPLLALMTALAVSDAVRETCSLETDIKWPNDVLADERKICGILAEAVSTPVGRAAIVGVGINLRQGALPPELSHAASSIEELTGTPPVTEEMLRALTRGLSRRYEELHGPDGPARLVDEWMTRSSYAIGLRVRVALGEEGAIEGTTRGLTSDGALRVETDDGQMRVVHAGDVSAVRVAK